MPRLNRSRSDGSAVPAMTAGGSRISPVLFWQSMILAAGGFVGLVDSSVIAVAVPVIARDFDAPINVVQWASAGYLLAMAAVIPFTSSLCHRLGAQRTWLLSLTVFTAATLAAGWAWSASSLILFRAIQGVGGGMLFPLMRLLAVEIAGKERMGRVMALTAIPVQVAPILGPVLGGLIIDGSSWRWALWASIPVALLALIPAALWIPNRRTDEARPVDYGAVLLLTSAITLTILFLSDVASSDFTAMTWMTGAVSACVIAGFIWRAHSSRKGVGFELSLLKIVSFRATAWIVFVNNFGMMGITFLIPLIVEGATVDSTGLAAGLALAPQGVGMLIAVLFVGKKIDIAGNPRRLVFGGIVGVSLSTLALAAFAGDLSSIVAMILLFVRGVALAFAIAPTMLTLYSGIRGDQYPEATTTNAIIQQGAGAFGAAFSAVAVQIAVGYSGALDAAFGLVLVVLALITACALLPVRGLPRTLATG